MNLTETRIGQTIRPAHRGAMLNLCNTYHPGIQCGVITDIDDEYCAAVTVRWIDHQGPQGQSHLLCPAQLITDHPGSPDQHRNYATPIIEMLDLKIYADRTQTRRTGLKFHNIDDANIALHAVAAAQEAFEPFLCPDTTSGVADALSVSIHWPLHINVYRLRSLPSR